MSESPPVRDREQAVRLVDRMLDSGGRYDRAERIVDALLPQPDPETARPDSWRRERDRALLRAERAEERLRAVIEAAKPVVEPDAILRTLKPQEITHLRAVLSSLPEPAPGQKSA